MSQKHCFRDGRGKPGLISKTPLKKMTVRMSKPANGAYFVHCLRFGTRTNLLAKFRAEVREARRFFRADTETGLAQKKRTPRSADVFPGRAVKTSCTRVTCKTERGWFRCIAKEATTISVCSNATRRVSNRRASRNQRTNRLRYPCFRLFCVGLTATWF